MIKNQDIASFLLKERLVSENKAAFYITQFALIGTVLTGKNNSH